MTDPVRNVKWSSEDARFIRQIMEDCADPAINEVIVMCSAQSAKTLTILALLGWAIVENPGPTLWVAHNNTEAKKIANMRLYPMLERCEPIAGRLPPRGPQRKTLELYLPAMPLILTGSEATGALQSTPYQRVICDEARSYKKGTLDMIRKRFRSYGANYTLIIISTPGDEMDELHLAWLGGDQRRLLITCPKCGHENDIQDWGDRESAGGLKWDRTDDTYDTVRGDWRWDALFATIRYECWNPECDHCWRDAPGDRKEISRHEKWTATNPNAPGNVRSYTWGALLPWWALWSSQVKEYLQALQSLSVGNPVPYRTFMTETRGVCWSKLFAYAKHDKYLEHRMVSYNPREIWEEEKDRFMTIDVQAKGGRHYVWVVRAWALGGWSRKIAHGIAYSLKEIRELQAEWKVKDRKVVFDSGAFTSEVYKYVVESGYKWKAMKGDDRWSFKVEGVDELYQITAADPAIGTAAQGKVAPIKLWVWAKYGVLDRLLAMMHGYIGRWEVDVEGCDNEYARQVTAMGMRTITDRRGGVRNEFYNKRDDDHYSDCEQMQIVCAAGTNLLSTPLPLEVAAEEVRRPREEEPPLRKGDTAAEDGEG